MMLQLYTLLGFLTLLFVNGETNIVRFPEACNREDAECLKSGIQKLGPIITMGDPDLGLVTLDPFKLQNVGVDLAGLKFTTNGTSRGYRDMIVDLFMFDFNAKILKFNFHLNTTMKGQYKAGGKLFTFPITGNGDIKIKTTDVRIFLTMPFDVIKLEDRTEHIKLKKFNLKFEIVGGVNYYMSNLFQGNEALSKGILDFLNNNWRIISNDFAGPVIQPGIEALYRNLNSIFALIPLEQMFLK